MLRIVLILCAVCAALIVVMALTRGGEPVRVRNEPVGPAPAIDQVAQPAVAKAEAPKAVEAPPPVAEPPPVEDQVGEDAAAAGMTTVEPPPTEPETPN